MIFKNIILSLVLFICLSMQSQTSLRIGEWISYLPYRDVKAITQTSKNIVISTGRALLFLDKDDLSKTTFDRTDGLSEALISNIYYDKFNDQLFIVYTNSNIDILKNGKVININDVKENSIITGLKEITDVHFADENICYMSTSFGILKSNLKNLEFLSTTFTDFRINNVTTDENMIYIGSQEGMYTIEKSSSQIGDFSQWKLLSSANGLPNTFQTRGLTTFNDDVYAIINEDVYKESNGIFNVISVPKPNNNFRYIYLSSNSPSHLIVGLRDGGNSISVARFIDENGKVINGAENCTNRTTYAIEDEKGRVWYGDQWRQIRYSNSLIDGCNKIEFDSPFSFESRQVEVMKNRVFFASEGARENFSVQANRSGIYIKNEDQTWTNINPEFNPIINEKNYLSHITVAPHPKENKVFIGSYNSGIILHDMDKNTFKFYNKNNSSLQTTVGDTFTTRIFQVKFDKDLNLWTTNFGAQRPISVFTKDSVWLSFNVPSAKEITRFTFDLQNRKWFVVTGSSGILVLDDGNTLNDPSDDEYKLLNSSNSELTSRVNCVETDLNGDVWVGTSEGPVVFECDPFETNCRGSRRKVLQDSIVAFLLETEDILCIEVDGANRKWFGTRNGIFVQSSDGEIQELKLDINNSPLIDNTINDLDFDGSTGLMYIATAQGIQAYRTDATEGTRSHIPENVYAYPNPVRPEFVGDIAIKGLARDANIKITDINGKLIYETKANGGLALWNGRDYNGNRAASGVYLVFSASSQDLDNVDSFVTKIMVIK